MGSIVLPAISKQTATMIFLHGLGDSGASWAEILPSFIPSYVKLVLPHAPIRPVTLNQGVQMPAWFDILPLDQPKDSRGIKHAANSIIDMIQKEIKAGIPGSRLLLGGFSQGGALALYTGLTGPIKLGGILGLSTWLPLQKEITWDNIQKPQVFQCHGDQDQMISILRATKTAKILKTNLPSFTFKVYPGLNHSISSAEEVNDIVDFIERALPPIPTSKL